MDSENPNEHARPLWQWAFLWIGDHSNLTVMHPLDVDRAKGVLADLSAVGERPSYREVKAFLATAWESLPDTQRQVRELWRRLDRNPGHRFRMPYGRHPRFYTLDRLVEEHKLVPLEERLRELAASAVDRCARAANGGSKADFDEGHGELERVAKAFADLRALRFGPAAVGRWWDRFESEDPPSGTRGTLT